MENQPDSPKNSNSLAARLAAARRSREIGSTDPAVPGQDETHDTSDDARQPGPLPEAESTDNPETTGTESVTPAIIEDNMVETSRRTRESKGLSFGDELRVAAHGLGKASPRLRGTAYKKRAELNEFIDDTAANHTSNVHRGLVPPRTYLSKRQEKIATAKNAAWRHEQRFGTPEEDAKNRADEHIMTRKERKRAVRKIRLQSMLGMISMADARSQIIDVLATPLDLGEHLRRQGETKSGRIRTKEAAAKAKIAHHEAKIHEIKKDEKKKETVPRLERIVRELSPPKNSRQHTILAEMYGLRIAGLTNHEAQLAMRERYTNDDFQTSVPDLKFINQTMSHPNWYQYEPQGPFSGKLYALLEELDSTDLLNLRRAISHGVDEKIADKKVAVGPDLNRVERITTLTFARVEVITAFLLEKKGRYNRQHGNAYEMNVTWKDIDQLQAYLYSHQKPVLPSKLKDRNRSGQTLAQREQGSTARSERIVQPGTLDEHDAYVATIAMLAGGLKKSGTAYSRLSPESLADTLTQKGATKQTARKVYARLQDEGYIATHYDKDKGFEVLASQEEFQEALDQLES